MATTTTEKINFIVNNDNFADFVTKLQDLTKISDTLKFKIDKDDILVYSLVGEVAILAFKNYKLETSEYFKFKEEDFDYTIDFIVPSAKKFVKKLTFFDGQSQIKMVISTKDGNEDGVRLGRSLTIGDSRFKVNQIGGETYKVRDINKEQLGRLLSPENSTWSFEISDKDLSDVKKLSSIAPEERIIDITVNRNKVNFSEGTKWNLNVGSTDEVESADITFAKKYLGSINTGTDYIKFSVFETFILFNDSQSNLMVSFEQSFEDDE
jgi:hypothetical protein